MLYICILPNRGARIGHQTDEYFFFEGYCKKFGFTFVYSPFEANAKVIGNYLQFDKINHYNFTDSFIQAMPRISICDLDSSPHEKMIEIHSGNENILLYDSMHAHNTFRSLLPRLTIADIMITRDKYSRFYCNHYAKMVEGPYICIHIRRGNICNMGSRYLSTLYFIDKYKYLLTKITEKDLPVYAITENNFDEEELLKTEIPNINIIKGGEIEAFQYLVNCNYLIASRSGFSNLAHFIGNMKIVPAPDWGFMPHNHI